MSVKSKYILSPGLKMEVVRVVNNELYFTLFSFIIFLSLFFFLYFELKWKSVMEVWYLLQGGHICHSHMIMWQNRKT